MASVQSCCCKDRVLRAGLDHAPLFRRQCACWGPESEKFPKPTDAPHRKKSKILCSWERTCEFPQSIYFNKKTWIRNFIVIIIFPTGYCCNLSFFTSVDFYRNLYVKTNFSKSWAINRLPYLLVSCNFLMRQDLHILVLSHESIFLHWCELKYMFL